MLRKVSVTILHKAPITGLINLFEGLSPKRPNLLRVLTYHLIEDSSVFEQQVDYLAKTYHVASMREVIDACQRTQILPPCSVMITFDDAYQNFGDCAWPILKQYNLPVTLFVPTAYPGNPQRLFWWDMLENAVINTPRKDSIETPVGRLSLTTSAQRIRAYKRLRDYVKTLPNFLTLDFVEKICNQLDAPMPLSRVLSWEKLRQLVSEGLTVGAHTRTHPLLNRISFQEAREEAAGSLRDLQREIGQVDPIFAYPSGYYTRKAVKAVKEAGFYLAFTTKLGTNDLNNPDLLLMRRNNLGRNADLPTLQARLLQAALLRN